MPDGVRQTVTAGSPVRLRGVSRRSGLVQVLNGIDLDLPGGLVTVLLGPPGAGKTTLCRVLGGDERVDSGSITVAGEPLRHRPGRLARRRRDRRAGVGPAAGPGSLLAHRTVLQNVSPGRDTLFGRLRSLGGGDADRRGPALLERVGSAGYGAHYPGELSPEHQQRVAIARALAAGPRLVLLDEPTLPLLSGPGGLPALPALLRGLAADGLAVLVATGDPGLARAVADRVVFIEGGRILEQGPPEEFFALPRTARARDFLSAAAKR